jgi:5-hydroxyisourate hydrolase
MVGQGSGSITSHILDTSLGRPAGQVEVVLERFEEGVWRQLGRGETNAEGRVERLHSDTPPQPGTYRLTFETGAYFARSGRACFHPAIVISFEVASTEPGNQAGHRHFHVPLLIAPFGYTTYRGS